MLSELVYEKNWISSPILTVVIPTSNRKDNLLKLLKALNSQPDKSFATVINDNGTFETVDIKDIDEVIGNTLPIRVYKNKFHLGPDASLLRGLELADSEWVYLLGESKIPVENFFLNFLDEINRYSEISSIVYTFDRSINKEIIINSVEGLIKSNIKFGDLFLSANTIVNKRIIVDYLNIANQMTLTRSILTVFNIMSLVNKKKILFSPRRIVKEFIEKPNHYNPKLSLLECWAQFNLLVMLPIGLKDAILINKLILKNEKYRDYWIFIKFSLLCMFRKKIDIRKNLKLIINCRYSFIIFSVEKLFIYPLYWISIVLGVTKYFKKYE